MNRTLLRADLRARLKISSQHELALNCRGLVASTTDNGADSRRLLQFFSEIGQAGAAAL